MLTPYSITNEEGELSVGLECANTHSLLSHKDSQANSHMIRNLSKNQLDAASAENEVTITLGQGRLTPGRNLRSFVMEVRKS